MDLIHSGGAARKREREAGISYFQTACPADGGAGSSATPEESAVGMGRFPGFHLLHFFSVKVS